MVLLKTVVSYDGRRFAQPAVRMVVCNFRTKVSRCLAHINCWEVIAFQLMFNFSFVFQGSSVLASEKNASILRRGYTQTLRPSMLYDRELNVLLKPSTKDRVQHAVLTEATIARASGITASPTLGISQ